MSFELSLPADAGNVNLYAVLGLTLPSAEHSVSTDEIKAAYRAALLKHHPDKSTAEHRKASTDHRIDTIQLARSILLSPTLRAEYDRDFLTSRHGQATKEASALDASAVLEAIDLDDMSYSNETRAWDWPCTCGTKPAYRVQEDDLLDCPLDEHGRGEVVVACEGCSLHKLVVFKDAEPA